MRRLAASSLLLLRNLYSENKKKYMEFCEERLAWESDLKLVRNIPKYSNPVRTL
ncbi:hypothetical protein FQR65_LT00442 [Abscondita terminalis]|nr:hypothetical protein FQR65_LT00442 [Abscondita terminalis]